MKFCVFPILISSVLLISSCTDAESNQSDQKDRKSKNHLSSSQSEITCPNCGHKKIESLPTDVCQISYTCEKCKTVLHPKEGDCCVFCTHGNHKCPSKQ